MAYLIRRGGLSVKQSEQLGKLEEASNHLLNVLNDILDLSKIEAGKFALEDVPVQIENLIANVVTLVHGRAEAKRLELVVENHVPPGGFLVPADQQGLGTPPAVQPCSRCHRTTVPGPPDGSG